MHYAAFFSRLDNSPQQASGIRHGKCKQVSLTETMNDSQVY